MSAELAQRARVGKYELIEEIGHGGMATVYRARDPRLGRDVAVKVIHRHLREHVEVAQRFGSEARAVAKLHHPAIVEVYDVSGDDDAEQFLVVELVRGSTLRRLLGERRRLPPEVAAALAAELADALDHAHEQGVVHRDIKPENVLLELQAPGNSSPRATDSSPRGATTPLPEPTEGPVSGRRGSAPRSCPVKLTDFGIAKLLDVQGVTSTGQVLGSPAHMAPEQIEGGEVGPTADVFGLGVLLYECLTGSLPFEGKNPAQVLRRVLEGSFVPAERVEARVGAPFSAIVGRALAHAPAQRWQRASELAAALRTELERLGLPDARAALCEYLGDPDAWDRTHEAALVDRLMWLGRAAAERREPMAAAADWNRALAYRPDDAELLRQITDLAQRKRNRRGALRAAGALGVVALLGGAAWALSLRRPVTPPGAPTAALRPTASALVPALVTAEGPRPPPSAVVEFTPAGDAVRRLGPMLRPVASVRAPSGSRPVQFQITGVKSGKLLMDGSEIAWFGPPREVPVGQHRFQLVPPNPTCCKEVGAEVREVPPGEGVHTLVFNLPFKDATLSVPVLPAGGRVGCSLLFAGQMTAPGTRAVQMRSAELTASCLLLPPPESGGAASTREVTLRPGQLSVLPW